MISTIDLRHQDPSNVDDYPLHRAAREGDVDTVKKLVESGYKVNEGNFDSVTALHDACLAGQYDAVKLLLDMGASVHSRNVDGATPLCDASNSGSVECVQVLLEYGAQVNPALNFTSPLHEAVIRDNLDVIEILTEAGANLESNDLHFGTPLHVAAYKNHMASARILMRAGADVNAAKTHCTALHLAAANNSSDMAATLLEFGANIYAQNYWSRSASEIVSCRSPLYKLLKYYEHNPLSLQQTCRLAIRNILSPRRLRYLTELSLPTYLKNFLSYNQ